MFRFGWSEKVYCHVEIMSTGFPYWYKETDKLIQSASLQSHKKLYAIQTTYKASDIIGKILKNFNKQFHGNMKEMAYETS